MMAKLTSISAIALAAMLVVAGCGGDSTLTTAELRKETDSICWKAHQKSFKGIQAYVLANGKNLEEVAPTRALVGEAVVIATVPAMRQGAEELAELDAPEEEKEKLEKFVAEVEKATKSVEENPRSDDATTGAAYFDANDLATKYKFGRCDALP